MILNEIVPILSPVLGGQLLKVTDWSGIFVVLSAMSIFIFILVWVGVKACIGITTTTSFSLAIQTQRDAAGSAAGLLGVVASPLIGLGGEMNAMPMGIILLGINFIALDEQIKHWIK